MAIGQRTYLMTEHLPGGPWILSRMDSGTTAIPEDQMISQVPQDNASRLVSLILLSIVAAVIGFL
jgi:hypothetical protein